MIRYCWTVLKASRRPQRAVHAPIVVALFFSLLQEEERPQLLEAPFTIAQIESRQEAWATWLDIESTQKNSIGQEFVLIPPGKFQMGRPKERHFVDHGETPHDVALTQPWYLGRTEVTQSQWKQIMGTEPWFDKERLVMEGDSYAASYISWFGAVEFCNRLSVKEKLEPYYKIDGEEVSILGGNGYRLPTEAEWEYSCRAGTTTDWLFGNDPKMLEEYAWFQDNAYKAGNSYPHQVGQKQPNSFGLYDMLGNVREWCFDWSTESLGSSAAVDPMGPDRPIPRHTRRVLRSSSFSEAKERCRSFSRHGMWPEVSTRGIGFRIARAAPGGE